MSEASKTNAPIQDWLAGEGGYAIKTIATNRAGVHDIICCLDGRFVSIEGKVGNNTPSRLQEEHYWQVVDAGGFAMFAWSLQEVVEAITIWRKSGYKTLPAMKVEPKIRIHL